MAEAVAEFGRGNLPYIFYNLKKKKPGSASLVSGLFDGTG